MKPKLEEDAIKYLREKGERLLKTFNGEMQRLVLHFQDYRIMMEGTAAHNHRLSRQIIEAEKLIAHQAPVNEALFGLYPKSPLELYNCLVPRLAEVKPAGVRGDGKFYQEQAGAVQLELESKDKELAELRAANDNLKETVKNVNE